MFRTGRKTQLHVFKPSFVTQHVVFDANQPVLLMEAFASGCGRLVDAILLGMEHCTRTDVLVVFLTAVGFMEQARMEDMMSDVRVKCLTRLTSRSKRASVD